MRESKSGNGRCSVGVGDQDVKGLGVAEHSRCPHARWCFPQSALIGASRSGPIQLELERISADMGRDNHTMHLVSNAHGLSDEFP